MAAVPIVLAPSAPAFAATPQCPSSGCDGAWVSESNCASEAAQVYPIASMLMTHQMQPNPLKEWMMYSPLCNTFWGQVENSFSGYKVGIQMWRQPQYGGRNVLVYSAYEDKGERTVIETRMVSAGGAVKFCIGSGTDDPDLTPDDGNYPSSNCTDFR